MRYFLFILLFISLACRAQEVKISNLPSSTAPDGDDLLIINEDGTTSKITRAQLFEHLSDSVKTNITNIATNTSDISDLSDSITDHRTDIDTNNDSIQINQDSITLHTADLDRLLARIQTLEGADVTAPYPDSLYILPNVDTIIYIIFNEGFDENATFSIDNAFSFTYGEISYTAGTVDSANAEGATVTIYCGTNIPSDSIVYVSYARPGTGGLMDESLNYVADFDTLLVYNSVSTSYYEPSAYYKFAGDLTEESGEYNGSAFNTIAYDGDTALIFSGSDGDDAMLISNSLAGDFSVSYWIYLDEDANENYYIFSNTYSAGSAGFYLYADGNGAGSFHTNFTVIDGVGGSTYAYENTRYNDDTWTHIVIAVDHVNGSHAYCTFYVNGTKDLTDSLLTNYASFTITGDLHVGSEKAGSPSNGLREGAKIDEFIIFDHKLDQEEVDSLYTIFQARESRLWQTTSTQTPTAPSENRTLYDTVYFTGATPGATINEALIDGFFVGAGAPTSSANTAVEDFMGDTVMRFTLPLNSPNTGVQWQYNFPSSYEEVWFGYNFFVPSDFILPTADAKFPGVSCGGTTTSLPTGTLYPPYCGLEPDYENTWGSTPRGLMVADDYHSPFTNDIVDGFGMYIYHHGMTFQNDCDGRSPGDKYRVYAEGDGHWTLGAWNNMTFRLKVNDVFEEGSGAANGIVEIYANGICRYVQTDVIFRNYSTDLFDEYFIILLGGPDAGRDRDQYVRFSDFELWMPDPDTDLRGPANPIGTDISSFITEK